MKTRKVYLAKEANFWDLNYTNIYAVFFLFFQDRDECSKPLENYCDAMATCINKPDGFSCQCPDGFHGDGRVCRRKRYGKLLYLILQW